MFSAIQKDVEIEKKKKKETVFKIFGSHAFTSLKLWMIPRILPFFTVLDVRNVINIKSREKKYE